MEENEKYQKLYAELAEYENCGVSMKLGNQPASPMQIVTAHMVQEENSYMRDYVWDEKRTCQRNCISQYQKQLNQV